MIESVVNNKVKDVIKLQKTSKARRKSGLFVVEGWRMISEVPNWYFDTIYVESDYEEKLAKIFGEGIKSIKIEVVSRKVMEAMSLESTSQGVLATVVIPKNNDVLSNTKNPMLVALEDIQDPGNLGTILRTADAAGVDQVVLSKGTVDLYNPKVVKATMGAIFRVSIVKDVDLNDYIDKIVSNGISVYAAHLEGQHNHYDKSYTGATCFLMGNEGKGLSDTLAKKATDYIRIPMSESAESLNVAMATGILIYEVVRQRNMY